MGGGVNLCCRGNLGHVFLDKIHRWNLVKESKGGGGWVVEGREGGGGIY